MAERTPGVISRVKLTVLSVGAIQKIGDKHIEKLTFRANDGHADLVYQTFRKDLFESIQVDKTLDCEIETKESNSQGETYINRNINQIYIDGQPVARGKYTGRRPEETASIEKQCAFKMVVELWIAGKFDDNAPIIGRLKSWLDEKTAGKPAESVVKPSTAVVKPAEKPGDQDWQKLERPAEKSFENAGQFMAAALKEKGFKNSQAVLEKLKINNVSQISDFGKAWKLI